MDVVPVRERMPAEALDADLRRARREPAEARPAYEAARTRLLAAELAREALDRREG